MAWQAARPGLRRDDPRIRAVFESSCALYRHAEACWAELPDERAWRVRYDDLVADPVGTLRAIGLHFGWELSDTQAATVDDHARASLQRVGRPVVPLRRFGLRASDLQHGLGDLDSLWRHLGRPRV